MESNKLKRIIGYILAIALFVSMLYICPSEVKAASGDLKIHFIDLKSADIKGDAVLLETDGRYLLIDTGDKDADNTVVNYLRDLGVKELA